MTPSVTVASDLEYVSDEVTSIDCYADGNFAVLVTAAIVEEETKEIETPYVEREAIQALSDAPSAQIEKEMIKGRNKTTEEQE